MSPTQNVTLGNMPFIVFDLPLATSMNMMWLGNSGIPSFSQMLSHMMII